MQIRMAEPSDAMAVAQVHIRSWRAAYASLLPAEYLAQMRPEDRAEKYDFAAADPESPKTILATEGDTILGFATTAPSRDHDLASHGELCALYVDPDRWGQGAGSILLGEALRRLFDQGFTRALLWMLAGNQRADRFYRRGKWLPDGTSRRQTVWGVTVDEIRYQRPLSSSGESNTAPFFAPAPD